MNFGDSYQYLIAWLVYFLAGAGCSIFWWKITSFMKKRVWRDLSRGIVLVLIFTPWYAGDTPEFYAPAIVVLLMDILLEGAKSGMKGGFGLLMSSFVMLLILALRQFLHSRPRNM